MLRVQPIDSLDLPELEPYRTLRYQEKHREQGIFVAESEKVALRLIQSPLTVVSIVLTAERLAFFREYLELRTEEIQVFVGSRQLLESLSGFPLYQGVMAVGKVPAVPALETVLRKKSEPLLLVATDGVGNALNMGALVRNCAAFSVDALIVGETCCSPFLRRAVAASTGTLFRLPTLEVPSLIDTLKVLRSCGVHCVAAHPHTDRRALPQANFAGDSCIVMGSEGDGISPEVLALCDEAVAIPMPPDVDSLNVGSATGVFLYEAARQRGKMSWGGSQ